MAGSAQVLRKKIHGKRASDLARKGVEVELNPVKVFIRAIELFGRIAAEPHDPRLLPQGDLYSEPCEGYRPQDWNLGHA